MKLNTICKRYIFILLGLLAAVSRFCVPAAASEPPPGWDREGRLTLIVEYGGEPVPGGSLTLFRAGEPRFDGAGSLSYDLTKPFRGSGLSLEDLSEPELPEELERWAETEGLKGRTQQTGKDGQTRFDALAPGLYLVLQSTAAAGYYPLSPFLVTLPRDEGDGWNYDLTARPKAEPRPVRPPRPRPTPRPEPTPEPTPTPPPVIPVPTPTPTVPGTLPTPEPTPTPKLPQTGQLNWPVPVLAVSGLVLFMVGWKVYFGKDRRDET